MPDEDQYLSADASTLNPKSGHNLVSYLAKILDKIGKSVNRRKQRSNSDSYQTLNALHDHCYSLPTTNACGRESIPRLTSLQLIQNCDNQSRAGSTKWVPERYRAAVYVSAGTIEAELFFNGQILRRKSFVNLNQIDLR